MATKVAGKGMAKVKTNHRPDELAGWKEIAHHPYATLPSYHLQDAAVSDYEYIEQMLNQDTKAGQGLLVNSNGEINEEAMSAWHQWVTLMCEDTPKNGNHIQSEAIQTGPPPKAHPRLCYYLSNC